MTGGYLLGVDIGTQSIRAVLFDTEAQLVASETEEVALLTPAPGRAEQDARVWWETTARLMSAVIVRSRVDPSAILCVGVGAQMHAVVPVDSNGSVLSPSVQIWCDKRSASIINDCGSAADSAQTFARTANRPSPAWQGFKISWLKTNEPDLYEKADVFLTAGGFIGRRLTGETTISVSEASGTFLMDAADLSWSSEQADVLGVSLDQLPRIVPPFAAIGEVTSAASSATGLAPGTPVVIGSDMMGTLLSVGLTSEGRAVDTSGTASLMSVYSSEPLADERVMNLHHDIEGWVSFGIIDSGGGSLRWFRDTFCAEDVAVGLRIGRDPYDLMIERAALTEEGSEGVLFFPYLLGERVLGRSDSRGAFIGLTPRTTRDVLTRSVLEGVTFELRRTLEIIESAGVAVDRVRVAGGGASSTLWNQIRADTYGRPVVQLKRRPGQGGALGMALLAGVVVGAWASPTQAADAAVRVDRVFHPRQEMRARYDAAFSEFKEIHDRLIP